MYTAKLTLAMSLFIVFVSVKALPLDVQVSIDTTPLAGVPGFLAFDFIDGDGLINNQATISNITTDAVLGQLSLIGDASGNLTPGPLLLGDTGFFNEALQELILGSSFAFRLMLTAVGPYQPIPDSFSFFILDDTFIPFPTSDPSFADALLVADIASPNPVIMDFGSSFATIQVQPIEDGRTVPEPTTIALISLGMASLAYQKRKQMSR